MNRGLFTILSLSMLGAGAIGGVVVHFLVGLFHTNQNIEEPYLFVGVFLLMLFAIAVFMAITGVLVFMTILLIYRFYKRHFTDEGYLTFTLPATTHQILLSSVVNILSWELLITLVGLVAYGLMLLPVFLLAGEFEVNVWTEMHYAMTTVFGNAYWLLEGILIICSLIGSTILPLLSITIGAQVAKKYKLLAGFGIYYGLSIAVSFITGIFSFVTMLGDYAIMETGESMVLTFLLQSLLYLGIGIGGYFLMHHLVKNRLNLP